MTGKYVLTLHLLAEFESSQGTQTDSYGYLKHHGNLIMPNYSWEMELKTHTSSAKYFDQHERTSLEAKRKYWVTHVGADEKGSDVHSKTSPSADKYIACNILQTFDEESNMVQLGNILGKKCRQHNCQNLGGHFPIIYHVWPQIKHHHLHWSP